jgi:hypothetical protein
MGMQKTGILERKALILLSLTILTLILTATLAIPTLAKKDEEEVEVKVKAEKVAVVISVEVIDGKIWVTIGIYKNGELIKTITFDPPGWDPGLP